MLSAIERDGRSPPRPVAGRRSHSPRWLVIGALAMAALGAGAFYAVGMPDVDGRSAVASETSSTVAGSRAPTTTVNLADHPASAAIPATSVPAPDPAPPSLAAKIEPASPAAMPSGDPLAKLALRDGEAAPDADRVISATPAKAKHAGHGKESSSGAKPHAGRSTASARGAPIGLAASSARKARRGDDDPDTELVAAIMARLDRRGPQPLDSSGAARASTLVEQVHRCAADPDPVESRQCRNRACENAWGKSDACPASRAPKSIDGGKADRGQRD